MAARYVAAMLRHQPIGPYNLGGASFGATVAYEMAVQLLAQGHKVGRLVIIDQRRPGWRLTARNALPAIHRILGHIPYRLAFELASIPAGDRLQHVQRTLLRWSKAAVGIRDNAAVMFGLSDPKQIAAVRCQPACAAQLPSDSGSGAHNFVSSEGAAVVSSRTRFFAGLARFYQRRGKGPYSAGRPLFHNCGTHGPTSSRK